MAGGAGMKVNFESTLAEAVETSLRGHRESRLQRRVQRGFGLATALLLAGAVGTRAAREQSLFTAILVGALAAVVSLLVYRAAAGWALRRALRTRWRAWFERQPTLPIEVELTGEALRFRQAGRDTTLAWSEIEGARELPGAVLLQGRHGLIGIVRDRAFAGAAERARFLETVNRHAAAHRDAPPG